MSEPPASEASGRRTLFIDGVEISGTLSLRDVEVRFDIHISQCGFVGVPDQQPNVSVHRSQLLQLSVTGCENIAVEISSSTFEDDVALDSVTSVSVFDSHLANVTAVGVEPDHEETPATEQGHAVTFEPPRFNAYKSSAQTVTLERFRTVELNPSSIEDLVLKDSPRAHLFIYDSEIAGRLSLIGSAEVSLRAENSTARKVEILEGSNACSLDLTGSDIKLLEVQDAEPPFRLPDLSRTRRWTVGSISLLGKDRLPVHFGPDIALAWIGGQPSSVDKHTSEQEPAEEKVTDSPESPESPDKKPSERFYRQPWGEVARILDEEGETSGARKVRIAAADRFMRNGGFVTEWFTRPLLRWTTGHGYASYRAIWGMFLCYAITWGLVFAFRSDFKPTGAADSGDYPRLWEPLYALDIVISPLGTGQSDAWWVTASFWLACSLVILKLTSWSLFGLFISGIAGVIDRRR